MTSKMEIDNNFERVFFKHLPEPLQLRGVGNLAAAERPFPVVEDFGLHIFKRRS